MITLLRCLRTQALVGALLACVLVAAVVVDTLRVNQPHADVVFQSDADLVNTFFPPRLAEAASRDAASGGPEPSRFSTFIVASLDASAARYIVALYSNGFEGALRILQRTGPDSAVVIAETSDGNLGGIIPALTLLDLDSDKVPEIVAAFSSARALTAQWVFKVYNNRLTLISPRSSLSDGSFGSTLFVGADFIDLDGDGLVEAIVPREFSDYPPTLDIAYDVYTLDNGRYRTTAPLASFNTFVRGTGAPVDDARSIQLTASGQYTLIVINGDLDGSHRVSSALIQLNGVPVVVPHAFNQQVTRVVVPDVTVATDNIITVRLTAAPASFIRIALQKQ